MSGSIALSEAPQKLLDQNKWAEVRTFAPNDLIALTYLNAPYPDLDAPSDFFWGGRRVVRSGGSLLRNRPRVGWSMSAPADRGEAGRDRNTTRRHARDD